MLSPFSNARSDALSMPSGENLYLGLLLALGLHAFIKFAFKTLAVILQTFVLPGKSVRGIPRPCRVVRLTVIRCDHAVEEVRCWQGCMGCGDWSLGGNRA